VELLLEEGYPPEAVLLELYMSGEFAFTLHKIAELGMIEQMALHSNTSQYGSMSRGMRLMSADQRERLRTGLDEIRSGEFARDWTVEQEAGGPTLNALREAARSMPLTELEQELRSAMGTSISGHRPQRGQSDSTVIPELASAPDGSGIASSTHGRFRKW
jgi:ketol-acid reductoisomerase